MPEHIDAVPSDIDSRCQEIDEEIEKIMYGSPSETYRFSGITKKLAALFRYDSVVLKTELSILSQLPNERGLLVKKAANGLYEDDALLRLLDVDETAALLKRPVMLAEKGHPASVERIRHIERRLFPEIEDGPSVVIEESSRFGDYIYFKPHSAWASGLVNEKIIKDLQEGKRLLTFGAGTGHLELLLAHAFGVDVNNMLLADKDLTLIPDELRGVRCDMYGQWPQYKEKFDYVFFPECLGGFGTRTSATEGVGVRANLIIKCFRVLNPGGQVRMKPYFLQEEQTHLLAHLLRQKGIFIDWNGWLMVASRLNDE